MSLNDGIWVYMESNEGTVMNVSYEILGKARDLSKKVDMSVTAVLVGKSKEIQGLADEIIARGADELIKIENDLLNIYRPEIYTNVVEDVIKEGDPSMFLIGATHNGVDLAGRLAVRLDTGMNADVIRLEIDENSNLVGGVPAFAGDILALVRAEGRPQMSTVRPGVFSANHPNKKREGDVKIHKPDIEEEEIVTEVTDRKIGDTVNLPSADIVVCAGRGFRGDLDLAIELAESLDATLGVTRPLCDEGLVSRDRQIGSTGYSLKADVAICAGISGSMYFTSGLEDVETVIAINIDSDEPIFEHADYCIEGDLFEILPLLVEKVKENEVEI